MEPKKTVIIQMYLQLHINLELLLDQSFPEIEHLRQAYNYLPG